jgi:hypothetical protein
MKSLKSRPNFPHLRDCQLLMAMTANGQQYDSVAGIGRWADMVRFFASILSKRMVSNHTDDCFG